MNSSSDQLAEVLAQRALKGFKQSGAWPQFVPYERIPESISAYADLKEIVRDAYELGWRRRVGEPTEIDEDLREACERSTIENSRGVTVFPQLLELAGTVPLFGTVDAASAAAAGNEGAGADLLPAAAY